MGRFELCTGVLACRAGLWAEFVTVPKLTTPSVTGPRPCFLTYASTACLSAATTFGSLSLLNTRRYTSCNTHTHTHTHTPTYTHTRYTTQEERCTGELAAREPCFAWSYDVPQCEMQTCLEYQAMLCERQAFAIFECTGPARTHLGEAMPARQTYLEGL